jgi:hypothetical protein
MARKKKSVESVNSNPPVAGLSSTIKLTAKQADEMFIQKYGKNHKEDTNQRTILNDFLRVIRMVEASKTSYDLNDVLFYSKALDLPTNEVIELFGRYTFFQIQCGRLEELNGVYDNSVFLQV